MLSLGKMHSRAKSRSVDNYLSIKVRAWNTSSLQFYWNFLEVAVSFCVFACVLYHEKTWLLGILQLLLCLCYCVPSGDGYFLMSQLVHSWYFDFLLCSQNIAGNLLDMQWGRMFVLIQHYIITWYIFISLLIWICFQLFHACIFSFVSVRELNMSQCEEIFAFLSNIVCCSQILACLLYFVFTLKGIGSVIPHFIYWIWWISTWLKTN